MMKQAQSYRSRPTLRASRPPSTAGTWGGGADWGGGPGAGVGAGVLAGVGLAFQAAWWIATFPFRLVFGVVSLLSRMTGVAVGFGLMVVGMALGAGPFYLIGVPIFLIGLLLTLRCLG